MTLSWSAEELSRRAVWRSAGTPRRIASFRSSGRPARPAPSSFRISRKRSAVGRRMMFWTRSGGIVDAVRRPRSRPPGSISRLARPGQAVEEVLAERRLRARLAGRVRAQRAEALLGDLHLDERLLRALVEVQVDHRPAFTPATRTSPPSTMPNALSSSTV